MGRSHRCLVRVFGPIAGVLQVHRNVLLSELDDPSPVFSAEALAASGPTGFGGFIYRAETCRRPPSFLTLDFTATAYAQHAGLLIEVLHDDEDAEEHKVFDSGRVVYDARREEETGDVYELGAPGVQYFYGRREGNPEAFLQALARARMKHRLQPL